MSKQLANLNTILRQDLESGDYASIKWFDKVFASTNFSASFGSFCPNHDQKYTNAVSRFPSKKTSIFVCSRMNLHHRYE